MEIIDRICSAIIMVMGIMMFLRVVYPVVGFIFKAKKYPESKKIKSYAVIIAARNESAVISNLIESINAQDYEGSLIKIFVVADNCTDNTADICREKGAVVYERNDLNHVRKGYALEFLFENIKKDFGINHVDGYFIFDADNLLAPDYISQMNNAFMAGEKIITSYRNSKNFEINIVTSAYGIHFYANSMTKHRPRSVLGFGTHLTGTGYLISSDLLTDGWRFTNFTEDDQATLVFTGLNIKTAYCEAAEFFDEQPCDFKTAFRQRIRWAKGRLQGFFGYGTKPLRSIFKGGFKTFMTSYDIFTHYFPYGLFTFLLGLIYPAVSFINGLFTPGANDYKGLAVNLILMFGTQYLYSLVTGIFTVIRDRNHIRCSPGKLVLYIFTYPWFNMISVLVYIIAILTRVEWKPIVHEDSRNIDDVLKSEKTFKF